MIYVFLIILFCAAIVLFDVFMGWLGERLAWRKARLAEVDGAPPQSVDEKKEAAAGYRYVDHPTMTALGYKLGDRVQWVGPSHYRDWSQGRIVSDQSELTPTASGERFVEIRDEISGQFTMVSTLYLMEPYGTEPRTIPPPNPHRPLWTTSATPMQIKDDDGKCRFCRQVGEHEIRCQLHPDNIDEWMRQGQPDARS